MFERGEVCIVYACFWTGVVLRILLSLSVFQSMDLAFALPAWDMPIDVDWSLWGSSSSVPLVERLKE
jgi:hypothetical protein